jgi:hypothetical protein
VREPDITEVVIRETDGMQGASATADSMSADVVGILDTIDVPIVVVGRDCKVTAAIASALA